MYDLHEEMNEFFQKDVRLGKKARDELAKFRDNSLSRLNSGLDNLGDTKNATYACPSETRNQGGYAMHTLNQARDNDYDIDVGLIFEKEGLPASPKSARERIRDAFLETGGQFKEPPEARKNAVTIWYASGQHLDFAIYRYASDAYDNKIIEHASGDEWKARDPDAMTNWFSNKVSAQSPSLAFGATVEENQLRKIARFAKFFAKSRTNWDLPGGMIMTTLIVESYRTNMHGDDTSLLQTLEALYSRLQGYTTVASPIDGSDLTANEKHRKQVENLKDRLGEFLPKLGILYSANCTREQARNAWRQFFNHDYWTADNDVPLKSSLLMSATAAPATAFAFPAGPRMPTKPQGFA